MKTSIEQVRGDSLATELEMMMGTYKVQLRAFGQEELYSKDSAGGWSKIESLGALVDATHNCIQHIMQARLGAKPKTYYSREAWVKCIDYQNYSKDDLVDLFLMLNRHLIHILRGVDPNDFYKACNSASKGTYHRCLKDVVRLHLEQTRFCLENLCKAKEHQGVRIKMLYS